MNPIIIKYSISRTVALVEGRSQYGEATYQPSDTELAFLSVDERKYLDGLNLEQTTFALPTGQPPTWPVIADSIKAARQATLDKQAAELAEREAKIVECLEVPDDKWISESTNYDRAISRRVVNVNAPTYCSHYSWLREDPRIVARIEALQPELERRRAVANAANEQAKADREAAEQRAEAAKAEAAAAKQVAIDDLVAWCIDGNGPDHLRRAADDGYDITGGLVQWLAESLRDELTPMQAVIIRIGTKLYGRYSWDERKSPGAKAFELLDAVTAAVKTIAHPTSVKVEVDRIMLVEVEPPEDSYDDGKQEFTGVVVKLSHPAAALRYLVIEVS